jgi:hypothetical protein
MPEQIKLPDGETFVAMTTTQYGSLYVASNKAVYRIDLRGFGREMVPVPIRDKETKSPLGAVLDRVSA